MGITAELDELLLSLEAGTERAHAHGHRGHQSPTQPVVAAYIAPAQPGGTVRHRRQRPGLAWWREVRCHLDGHCWTWPFQAQVCVCTRCGRCG